MKKNYLFSVVVAVVISAVSFTSCGSSKSAKADSGSASAESSLGQRVEKSPAQIYAEDPVRTNLRGWGFYNGFPDQNLEAFAAAAARAQLADQVATLVKDGVDRYENGQRINNLGVRSNAEGVMTEEAQNQLNIQTVSKELIEGSRIAVSDRFAQKDGTQTCYVAVEISVDELVDKIKKSGQIKEAISKSRRDEIAFDSKQFKESIQSSFDDLKEEKDNR